MSSQIVCVYTALATGIFTPAQLQASMAAVPLDTQLLVDYGLRVIVDSTPAPVGNLVTRTITVSMVPSAPATVTAVLFGGDPTGSPVASLSFTPGLDYVAPPVVTAASPVPPGGTAQMHVTLGVLSVSVTSGGTGFTGTTQIVFSGGGLAAGGVQATGTPIIALGVITGVTVTSPGGPYTSVPSVVANDTAPGTDALLVAHLGLTGAVLDAQGSGYSAAPAVTVTPLFKALFPDGTDQVSPLANWMTEVFQNALKTSVVAAVPVVS